MWCFHILLKLGELLTHKFVAINHFQTMQTVLTFEGTENQHQQSFSLCICFITNGSNHNQQGCMDQFSDATFWCDQALRLLLCLVSPEYYMK